MNYRCSKKGCELEAQYVRNCLLSDMYFCDFHMNAQLNLLNKDLAFDSIFIENYQKTKDAILEFLEKEKHNRETLKTNNLAAVSQNIDISSEIPEEILKNLDSDLEWISGWIDKISQTQKVAKKEEDSFLNLLTLQPDSALKKLRKMIPTSSEQNSSIRRFYWLKELKAKTSEIWDKPNNFEFEQDFRKTCSLYENQKLFSDLLLEQAYQEYVKAYHQTKSIYRIHKFRDHIKLFIYDTEEEREDEKVLKFKEIYNKSIHGQLSNGQLFCNEKTYIYCEALFIDKNYELWMIPSPFCYFVPFIYFSRSIYCYGIFKSSYILTRFDLDQKKWKYLSHMPSKDIFNAAIFNGNILIAGKGELFLYSIEINSFSIITYNYYSPINAKANICYTEHKDVYFNFKTPVFTFVIQGDERLYIIDFFDKDVLVYESEVEDVYTWKSTAKSAFDGLNPIFCLYNKRKIYFSVNSCEYSGHYYKFDLDLKSFTENSCYFDFVTLKEVDKKLVEIKWYNQTFKFDLDSAAIYIKKGNTVNDLGYKLNCVEIYSRKICKRADFQAYYIKGRILMDLDMYIEAIEYFNEALLIKHNHQSIRFYYDIWYNKGDSFWKLGRYIEAIECYDQAYKITNSPSSLIYKGSILLYNLGNSLGAIKCFDELIKKDPNHAEAFFYKANALIYDLGWNIETVQCYYKTIKNKHGFTYPNSNKIDMLYTLERNLEAVECYNKAMKLNLRYDAVYNNKGAALNALGKNQEAIECLNSAIDANPEYFLAFCNRARAFNDLECEVSALNDLNTAYNIMLKTIRESLVSNSAKKKIYELNRNFINDTIKEYYLKLLKRLIELQEYVIEFKNKSQKIMNFALNSQKVMSKIEMQNKEIKTQSSQLIKRFIEFLAFTNYQPYEGVQQKLYDIEKEAAKIEKLMTENISDLRKQANIF